MSVKTIKVFDTVEDLSIYAARQLIRLSKDAIRERGQFLITLSGGSTPMRLFGLLSHNEFADQLDWAKTHTFWTDERCVPPDDPDSNYFQAWDTLLKHVPIPDKNIHRIQGELQPAVAAKSYAQLLGTFQTPGKWPRMDLILLGLGEDGHTASLFPGSDPEPGLSAQSVTASYQGRPANRVTLTSAVFNDARQIFFMAAGENKAWILKTVINGPYDPKQYPAQRIHPEDGLLTWLVDKAAAQSLR
ncbi:MAG: 6-phosphogluconolactonase [Anaerolineales bacterium]|nr:6-phosphogluconolactonase [Anaerolineales bacterium]